jgi:hypothetical protein
VIRIPAGTMVALKEVEATGVHEVRAEVQWDENKEGHRFFHVRHDPVPPCVSELIEAAPLQSLSGGKQRMSGMATMSGDVVLEVWSSVACSVDSWKMEVV